MTDKEEIKDGLVETFYENGQLEERENWKNGKEDGLWETFHSKSDNNPFVLHGPIRTKGDYKDGKRDGRWEVSNYNGQ